MNKWEVKTRYLSDGSKVFSAVWVDDQSGHVVTIETANEDMAGEICALLDDPMIVDIVIS